MNMVMTVPTKYERKVDMVIRPCLVCIKDGRHGTYIRVRTKVGAGEVLTVYCDTCGRHAHVHNNGEGCTEVKAFRIWNNFNKEREFCLRTPDNNI